MPRLVTFGCSYTFGEGLPDTYPLPNALKDRYPSKFAWPVYLAEKLGYECDNQAWGGSGNLEILLRILKYQYCKDDLVIIQWSHFTRYDFFQITDKEANGYRIYDTGPTERNYKELVVKLKLQDKNWEANSFVKNWLCISHANIFLRLNNIKNFFFLHTTGWEKMDKPTFLETEGFIDIEPKEYFIDKGLDDAHFDIKSHALQAELIYNKIQYELR